MLENPTIDGAPVKTFVIDPITVVNDAIAINYENKMKVKTGNSNYQLKPLDYKFIKAELKQLGMKLMALDMNVIVTARDKTLYSQAGFMEVAGTTADGPKEFPFLFDVVIRLEKKPDGKFWAYVEKDRTNTLPVNFEYTYQEFVKYLGMENLEREAVVFKQQEALKARSNRNHKVIFKGNEIFTAGISADNIEQLETLVDSIGEQPFLAKLKDDFLVESVLDLKDDEAHLLITDLQKQLTKTAE